MAPCIFKKDHYNPPDLLQAGLDHLKATEILLKHSPEVFDSAGYLAHMGLELMLKSWILYSMGEFKGIHALKELIEDLNSKEIQLCLSERELQTLVYLKKFEWLRYPCIKTPVEIGSEDLDQIYKIADAIWQQMPDQLVEEFEKIPFGKKSGRVLMKRPITIHRNLKLETGICS